MTKSYKKEEKKYLFLDALSIKKKNLESFLKSKPWPVSEKVFFQLTNFVYDEYIKELKKLDQKAYKIALIEMRFLPQLINIFHYNYIKNFANKNKYNCIYSKSAEQFLNPNWDEIANAYQNFKYPYNKLQRIARKLIKLIYFNRHLSVIGIINGIFSVKENISLGSFDKIKQDYIKQTNKFFLHIEWIDLINKANFAFSKKKANKKISINIINQILKKLKNNPSLNFFIKGLNVNEINLVSKKRLKSISIIYDHLSELKAPKSIILTESAKPFHKIISTVFLSKGAKVVNFSHGNDLGLVHQKWLQSYLYAQAGNYCFENNKICNIFEKTALSLPLAYKEKTNFFSINTNIGLTRQNIIYPKIRKNKIKKVMVMGYPMNSTRYTDEVYCYFHYRLKLLIFILKQLKILGYYTIYKGHPERVLELGDLMDDYTDKCNDQKFEQVWHEADAFIFTYCTTTTFGFALTTPIPIVLINESSTNWNFQRKLQIEKRIHILDYSFNNNKYIGLNNTNLNNGLQSATNKVPLNKIRGF